MKKAKALLMDRFPKREQEIAFLLNVCLDLEITEEKLVECCRTHFKTDAEITECMEAAEASCIVAYLLRAGLTPKAGITAINPPNRPAKAAPIREAVRIARLLQWFW